MPQFTNPFNAQNGQIAPNQNVMSSPMNMNNWNQGPGMQQPSAPTFQPSQIPNDWRPYSPQPQPALSGKWVNQFEDIRPIDVPQDGSLTLFPQTDKSCIYAMTWGIDGRIQAFRFVPEKLDQQSPPSTNDISDPVKEVLTGFTTSMYNRMDALESRIGDILSRFEPPVTTQSAKAKKTTQKEGEQV